MILSYITLKKLTGRLKRHFAYRVKGYGKGLYLIRFDGNPADQDYSLEWNMDAIADVIHCVCYVLVFVCVSACLQVFWVNFSSSAASVY